MQALSLFVVFCVASCASAAPDVQLSAWGSFRSTSDGRGVSAAVSTNNSVHMGLLAPHLGFWNSNSLAFSRNGTEVIAGSNDTNVYSLDIQSGAVRWSFPTGDTVFSSPTVSLDGETVFVGSLDHMLYAVDMQTGKEIWKVATGDGIWASPSLSPDGSTVFVGSLDTVVYAFDAATGAMNWKFQTNSGISSSCAVSVDGASVYVGSRDNNLYALDAHTGALQWQFATGNMIWSSPAVSIDSATVVLGSMDGYVYAIDAEAGSLKWKYNRGKPVTSSPALSTDGNAAFIGTVALEMHPPTGAGKLLWEFSTDSKMDSSSPAVSLDGATVVVGSLDGNIYSIDAQTGARRWSFQLGQPVTTSPAISADGLVHVVGPLGGIHRFGLTASYLIHGLLGGVLTAVRDADHGDVVAAFEELCAYDADVHFLPQCNASAPPKGCNVCEACCKATIAPGLECVECFETECPPRTDTFSADAKALVKTACQSAQNARNGGFGWHGAWENHVAPLSYAFYGDRIDPATGDMFALLQTYEKRESDYLAQISDLDSLVGYAEASQAAVEDGDMENWRARIARSQAVLKSYGNAIVDVEQRMHMPVGVPRNT